jgi:hypothetical protein
MPDHTWFLVTLREWLEHQEHENAPHRAELSAAIHHGDVDRVRTLLRAAPFSAGQRRYLDDLLRRWEESMPPPAEGDRE